MNPNPTRHEIYLKNCLRQQGVQFARNPSQQDYHFGYGGTVVIHGNSQCLLDVFCNKIITRLINNSRNTLKELIVTERIADGDRPRGLKVACTM